MLDLHRILSPLKGISMKRSLSSPAKGFIGLIAGICALGTGLLAAATVISTPTSLLLFLAAGFVVNYTTPIIYRKLARWTLASELDDKNNHKNYLMKVLKSEDELSEENVPSVHARNLSLKRYVGVGFGSLALSMSLATGLYFLASLIPAVGLLYSVAGLMFGSLAIVTAMNFYGGMSDVWRNVSDFKLEVSKKQGLFLGLCVLSCVAAGLLAGAITREGVQTTIPSLFPIITAAAGPLGWIVLSTMVLAVFSMMAYEIFNMMKSDKLTQKIAMLRSFFSPEQYLKDLKNDWKKINGELKTKKAELLKATDDATKTEICHAMDELYRQKDSVYHRFHAYQQKGFFVVYAVVSAVVFAVSMAGMLMHLARNYQAFNMMLPATLNASRAISTSVMYLAMLSESIFTGTIVTSTMNEEALLGSQSKKYEDALYKQQKLKEKASGYFYQTSRGMHFIYETLLGLFGAAGHGAKSEPTPHGEFSAYHAGGSEGGKTGQAFADYKGTANMMSFGMGVRAGLERHEIEMPSLHFMYKKETGGISRVALKREVEEPAPRLIPKVAVQ